MLQINLVCNRVENQYHGNKDTNYLGDVFATLVSTRPPEQPCCHPGPWLLSYVDLECTQSWIFIPRTDAKAPILRPHDAKNGLVGKDPDAGRNWRQEEKGTTEDEMVKWHHWLNGHDFDQTLGVGDEQGSLARCSPWGLKESDMIQWLNWTEKCTHLFFLPLLTAKTLASNFLPGAICFTNNNLENWHKTAS